jgi:2,4-dienoyl-CoA reductase-like NADH-dependent reductase (Old Yellow Enzyme family)
MAGPGGEVTDELVTLYEDLARGGAGLIFTGHFYCHPRGRYGKRQVGIDSDTCIEGLSRVTSAVHRHGGRVFAQIAHAGSQTLLPDIEPLAPSAHPNVMTGREVADASRGEIEGVIESFRDAARRAAEAGFDGVHIHGANGYLISEFRSPITNRREDRWGGSAEGRERFPIAVVEAVRDELPPELALTMKLGFRDIVDEPGLELDDAVAGAKRIAAAGLDAIEVSSNLMSDYVSASIRAYVAVTRRRALEDLLFHRLHRSEEPEAYFRPFAQRLRGQVDAKIVLVGGMRRPETMAHVIESRWPGRSSASPTSCASSSPGVPARWRASPATCASCTRTSTGFAAGACPAGECSSTRATDSAGGSRPKPAWPGRTANEHGRDDRLLARPGAHAHR